MSRSRPSAAMFDVLITFWANPLTPGHWITKRVLSPYSRNTAKTSVSSISSRNLVSEPILLLLCTLGVRSTVDWHRHHRCFQLLESDKWHRIRPLFLFLCPFVILLSDFIPAWCVYGLVYNPGAVRVLQYMVYYFGWVLLVMWLFLGSRSFENFASYHASNQWNSLTVLFFWFRWNNQIIWIKIPWTSI